MRGFRCEKAIYARPFLRAPYVISGFADNAPFAAAEFSTMPGSMPSFSKGQQNAFRARFSAAWDNGLYESPSLGYVNATHKKHRLAQTIWTITTRCATRKTAAQGCQLRMARPRGRLHDRMAARAPEIYDLTER